MDYEKNLLEERATAVAAARSILDAAAAEKRSLSAEESTSVDRAFAEVDAKGKMVEDIRRLNAHEAEVRASQAAHEEARPVESRQVESVVDDAELIRKMARGEMRSHTFERRDILKTSTGAPVPTSFYDRLITVARATGPMLNVATTINTSSGENLQIPRVQSYGTAAIAAEGGPILENDPTFLSFLTLSAYKYSFLLQLSTEMLADTGVDILGFLGTNLGQAVGFAVNADLTLGTGNSVQPNGIVPQAGSGVIGGTGLTVVGNFSADKLIDLVYSTDAAVRTNPNFSFMGSTTATAAARKLADSQGRYFWEPSLQVGQPDKMLGYSWIENRHMAAVAASAKSVIAGDLSSYLIRQVGGVQLDRSDDFAFSTGLVTFRATLRLDGGLPQSSHVRYFVGAAT